MKKKLIVVFLMLVMAMIFATVVFAQSANAGETWLITYRITLGSDVVEQDSLVITFTSNSSNIKTVAASRLGYNYSQSGGYWTKVKTPSSTRPYNRLYILSTVKL